MQVDPGQNPCTGWELIELHAGFKRKIFWVFLTPDVAVSRRETPAYSAPGTIERATV